MTHFWIENLCLSRTLGMCLNIDLISITQKADFIDFLHPKGDVTQNDFKKSIRMSWIKTLFLLFSRKQYTKKIHYVTRAIVFVNLFLQIKFWLILFKLLNLHLWHHTAPCTLHNVHNVLHPHLQMPLNLNMYTSYYILNTANIQN